MAVSIKHKIRLGTGFLLMLLILLGSLSIFYLIQLQRDAKNILKDNYDSIDYCHHMLEQLDSMRTVPIHQSSFDAYLTKQENNITEPGESEATKAIRDAFQQKKYELLPQLLQHILSLNMDALQKKNSQAEIAAEKGYTIIIVIAVFTFIVGLTFSINFPLVVTTPIEKLMEAIKAITAKNYRYRIHLDTKDEFGQLAEAFNTMSGRLEDFENSNLNKLIFEKTRAEAVINSLKDASIGIDKKNRILFANKQALQFLGLPAEDTVGKSAKELSEKNDLFRFLNNNETNAPFKIVVDGKENFYTRELVEIPEEGGFNKVIVLKNITSFKELDVAKTNFIATISHELKTPLASSDFSLQLLEDNRIGMLSKEQQDLVVQLKNDNQRMLRILSELLNMSQVEAGKIQLDIQSVSVHQIVDATFKAVASAARENELFIELQLQPDLLEIRADADKLTWVLNNLVLNAIKYSPRGEKIIISVKQQANSVSFSVSDKGPGIEATYLPRVFERYFQVPGRPDKKGSGIGLAIGKEMIEAMNGQIWVNSKLGWGSTFGFDLPIH